MGNLDVWYARLDVDALIDDFAQTGTAAQVEGGPQGADEGTAQGQPARRSSKLTETVDGELRIRSEPPLLVPGRATCSRRARPSCCSRGSRGCWTSYRRSLTQDERRTCSTATASSTWPTRSSASAASAPVPGSSCSTAATTAIRSFLQAKEAQASVLEPHLRRSALPPPRTARRRRSAPRCRRPATSSSAGSASTGIDGVVRDFYVRQLWDGKGSVDVSDRAAGRHDEVRRSCAGWTLARAHARSGDRVAIAAYLGGRDRFDRAIADVRPRVRRPERARPPRPGGRGGRRPGRGDARNLSGPAAQRRSSRRSAV